MALPGLPWACPALALLPLALLPLTRRLPASVGEVAAGILQSRGRACEVARRGDAPVRARQRLAQPIQRRARPSRVALRQALGRVAQCRSGRAVRLRCRRLEAGQLAGELALLLGRQPVELVAEVLEVVARLLRDPRRGSPRACRWRRSKARG